jgi:predicted nucleic acid-binding protein
MILLDTNVVSEPLKPTPESKVLAWLDRQPTGILYLPSVALAELLAGIEIMPEGRRKGSMLQSVRALLQQLTSQRVLPFDVEAAEAYSLLTARARSEGVSVALGDGEIGAIAHVHGLAVATRDERPFLAMGLRVINPWAES